MAEFSAVRSGPRSISSLVLPIPILCFVGALCTDLAYRASGGTFLWLNFSSWLIACGLTFGGLCAVVMLIETMGGRGWLPLLLLLAAWVVEFVNALVHARDGWTAVVPLGLTLSIVGSLLALVSGWIWRSTGDRR